MRMVGKINSKETFQQVFILFVPCSFYGNLHNRIDQWALYLGIPRLLCQSTPIVFHVNAKFDSPLIFKFRPDLFTLASSICTNVYFCLPLFCFGYKFPPFTVDPISYRKNNVEWRIIQSRIATHSFLYLWKPSAYNPTSMASFLKGMSSCQNGRRWQS